MASPPIQLDPGIRTALASLRRRIRCYVWVQGLAAVVAVVGVIFWGSLAVDWFFEPSVLVRKILFVAAVFGIAVAAYRAIGQHTFFPLPDRSMAILLERRFSEFDAGLLTAVELTARPPDPNDCNRAMLETTCRALSDPLSRVRLGDVFTPRPLRVAIVAALLLAVATGSFRALAPQAFAVWLRRTVLMSDELWPRRTILAVKGFPDGVARVARGADFTLIAEADMTGRHVPRSVRIDYRLEGSPRLDATMIREGQAQVGRDAYQAYSYTFRGILSPIDLNLRGGDASIRNLRIEVVDAPTLVRLDAECRYPDYMGRSARTLPAAGVLPIPRGTEVVLHAEANKPLTQVQIDDGENTQFVVDASKEGSVSISGFNYLLQSIDNTKTIELVLHDTDGIKSNQPIRIVLSAVEDQPPQPTVQLDGIGSAITPQARLPFNGQVQDDHGVQRVWLEYAVEGREPRKQTLRQFDEIATQAFIDHAFDVDSLRLEPGQKILIAIKASDRYNLEPEPNVGSGDRWMLDVVTAEKLRAILEAREIVLRQRFETIVEDVEEIRDTLAELTFDNESSKTGPEPSEAAEPGEFERPDSAYRRRAVRLLRIQRSRQNGQKDSHETSGVSQAFADIRKELINNRIYTEELRIRIEQDIVAPLNGLVKADFVQLDERLAELEATHDDRTQSPKLRDAALDQTDTILRTMQEVLARMVELEDFNEAVQLLRSIIEEQEQLREAVRERRKEKLRQLLGD